MKRTPAPAAAAVVAFADASASAVEASSFHCLRMRSEIRKEHRQINKRDEGIKQKMNEELQKSGHRQGVIGETLPIR